MRRGYQPGSVVGSGGTTEPLVLTAALVPRTGHTRTHTQLSTRRTTPSRSGRRTPTWSRATSPTAARRAARSGTSCAAPSPPCTAGSRGRDGPAGHPAQTLGGNGSPEGTAAGGADTPRAAPCAASHRPPAAAAGSGDLGGTAQGGRTSRGYQAGGTWRGPGAAHWRKPLNFGFALVQEVHLWELRRWSWKW
jgi:hypothetical protein